MNRGCVWCKMRDAILGCMGGEPKNCAKGGHSRRPTLTEESSRGDNSETFGFDDRGNRSTRGSSKRAVSKGRTGTRGRPGRLRLTEEYPRVDNSEQCEFDDRGLGRVTNISKAPSRGFVVSTRGKPLRQRQASLERHRARGVFTQKKKQVPKADQCTQTQGIYYKPVLRKKRKSPLQPPSKGYEGNYDHGHLRAYCDFYYKQYQRDLLKRQAEKFPLFQYHYEQGRPLRGILKKPQFIRTPRMDEIIVVEVMHCSNYN